MKLLAACVAVVCLASVAACSAAADEPPPAPAATAFRLTLPFDEYKWNPLENAVLERARYLLVQKCVRARGIAFTMPEPGRTGLPGFYDNSRRYGALDAAAVAVSGYHLPRTAGGRARQQRIDQWNSTVGKAEETAVYGDDGRDPGCYAQADGELEQGVPRADTAWLGKQSAASLDATRGADAVVRAKAGWRTCMTGLGYSYTEPDAAIDDPRWALDSPTVSGDEVKTASADVRCKNSAGLVTAWQQAETAWQRQVIDREPERFRLLKAAKEAKLTAAQHTASGH